MTWPMRMQICTNECLYLKIGNTSNMAHYQTMGRVAGRSHMLIHIYIPKYVCMYLHLCIYT